MTDDADIPPLVPELAHALGLLRSSHELYHEILGAFRDNVAASGEPNLPDMLARLNKAMTEFAPRDREIRRLLDRFDR